MLEFDHHHLAAYLAVLETGRFESAAMLLHVTPSAISQRIRALEEQLGQVLLIRRTPIKATAAGEALYRHALQIRALEHDWWREWSGQQAAGLVVPVAVNADSLATWFFHANQAFHAQTGATLEVMTEDQEFTAEWLRQGRVMGAVTSLDRPVAGCRVVKLGMMRYWAVAAPEFKRRYFAKGLDRASMTQAPAVAFNRKDLLHEKYIKTLPGRGPTASRQTHWWPSSHSFQQILAAGMGWGVAPTMLIAPFLQSGELVRLSSDSFVDVPLYWQSWALETPTLAALTQSVKKAVKPMMEKKI
jgi:LysR family transcriptional regulator (chromosome initiation inhibitor)